METKQRLTTCMQRLQACSPGRPTDRAICPNTLINGRLNLSLAHAYALRGVYTYSQQLTTYILAGLLSTAISTVQPSPASATLYPQCVIPAYHFYSLITSSRKAYVFCLCVFICYKSLYRIFHWCPTRYTEGQQAPPHPLFGLGSTVSSPAGFGAEPLPLKGFPIFSILGKFTPCVTFGAHKLGRPNSEPLFHHLYEF